MSEELPQLIRDNPRLGAWFAFPGPDRLVLKTGKVEIGQRILSALRQIAAEELDLPMALVGIASGDTTLSPNESGTFASISTMTSGAAVRVAASELRGRLFQAAASRLGVGPADLGVSRGIFLLNGRPTAESYWTVAPAIDLAAHVTGAFPPKRPDSYTLVGTSPAPDDLVAKISGAAFIHDLVLDGMVHGRALRQPYPGAKLLHVETARVEGRPGIVALVRDGDFIGLVADTEAALVAAMGQLDRAVRWEEDPEDFDATPQEVLTHAASEPVTVCDSLVERDRNWQYRATFSKPLTGHGSIGPSCAVAQFRDNALLIWTQSQDVFELRSQIARVIGWAADRITVRHLPGAGCYGHNGADDVALDAVLLARALPGRPVRAQWSRRDELRAEPLGSPMSVSVSASLADGRIEAWDLTTRSGTHLARPGWAGGVNLLGAAALSTPYDFNPPTDLPLEFGGGGGAKNSVAGYDFPQRVTYAFVPGLPYRLSALRALGSFANVLAIESAMDDLAELAGADPVRFRLDHLSNRRSRRVIKAVAAMCGWDVACEPGTAKGLGFAHFENEMSYCAVVAHVSVEEDVRLLELWAAVDAGLAINPAGIVAQVEGGMIQSASWTLKEAVPTAGRRVTSETWKDYPILRFDEIPEVSVRVISDPSDPSTGVGEFAMGPTAAAIANAVARALGVRVRDLPITRDRIIAAITDLPE